MAKFTIMITSSIFGTLFWWIGNFINPDVGFGMSLIGGVVGLFYGVKWSAQYS